MVGLITGAAYTVAALGTNAEIPPGIGIFVGILLALLLCAHIAVRLVAAVLTAQSCRWLHCSTASAS